MSWLFRDLVVIIKEIMRWLFKDPISNDMTQFDPVQSRSKNWFKGYKKIKFPQMNFFLEKQLIKFSCTF